MNVVASGRTDAGVHALAQVAAVTLENPIPPDNFRRAVNRLLPYTVRVNAVEETSLDFHPRFHAKRKTYEYRVFREEVCPPFDRRFVYHHPYPLNEAAMISAAKLFEGKHDFTAFASADKEDHLEASKIRTIFHAGLVRSHALLVFAVTGSGFLKYMVRNMMGGLIEVGKGNFSEGDILSRFDPACGLPVGPAVPGSGLFLVSVDY